MLVLSVSRKLTLRLLPEETCACSYLSAMKVNLNPPISPLLPLSPVRTPLFKGGFHSFSVSSPFIFTLLRTGLRSNIASFRISLEDEYASQHDEIGRTILLELLLG